MPLFPHLHMHATHLPSPSGPALSFPFLPNTWPAPCPPPADLDWVCLLIVSACAGLLARLIMRLQQGLPRRPSLCGSSVLGLLLTSVECYLPLRADYGCGRERGD